MTSRSELPPGPICDSATGRFPEKEPYSRLGHEPGHQVVIGLALLLDMVLNRILARQVHGVKIRKSVVVQHFFNRVGIVHVPGQAGREVEIEHQQAGNDDRPVARFPVVSGKIIEPAHDAGIRIIFPVPEHEERGRAADDIGGVEVVVGGLKRQRQRIRLRNRFLAVEI